MRKLARTRLAVVAAILVGLVGGAVWIFSGGNQSSVVTLHGLRSGESKPGSLVGRSLDEVTRSLGPPHAGRSFTGWDCCYRLGDDGSYFSIDSSWLVLRVQGGQVLDARVIVD